MKFLKENKKRTRVISFALVLLFFTLAIWGSTFIADSQVAKELVQRFGYIGIVVVAFFGGLNLIIPIPAVTFTPVFLSGGLSVYGVILSLVIGTAIADFISYAIGIFGRNKLNPSQYKAFKKLESLSKKNKFLPLVVLFVWAAVMPLPNEVLLIPLGLLGFKLKSLIIPFIAGNIIHHSLLVFGISSVIPFFNF